MTWSRRTLAAFWIGAGTMHFVRPRPYEAIVPPPLRARRREVVQASGVAEILGGAAVLGDRTLPLARAWLLATLAAVYPANVWMALNPDRFDRIPRALLWARLPLQAAFAVHVVIGTTR